MSSLTTHTATMSDFHTGLSASLHFNMFAVTVANADQ